MKRISRLIIFALIFPILFTNICLSATGITTTETNDITQIKAIISKCFTYYCSSIENPNEHYSKSAENFASILDQTNSAYEFLSFLKWKKAALDELELNYQDCNPTIEFARIDVQDKVAVAEVIFSMTYHYSFSPDDISSISNVQFLFELKYQDSMWKISAVDSDWLDYVLFQESLEYYANQTVQRTAVLPNTSKQDDISIEYKSLLDEFLTYKISDIDNVKRQLQAMDFSAPQIATNTALTTSSSSQYQYNASRGVSYALTYATADTSSRLFYTTGSDCTNFVSQCVWAAYGGYVASNLTTTRNNITNKVRMVPDTSSVSGWYGGTGGGSPAWESVESFYNYVTADPDIGPKGTGVNNNQLWTSYPNYYGSTPVGTVLQFYSYNKNRYGHSVYVTDVTVNPTPDTTYGFFKTVSCSYHSTDTYKRSLIELIVAWGGSNCKMRGISFETAKFSQ